MLYSTLNGYCICAHGQATALQLLPFGAQLNGHRNSLFRARLWSAFTAVLSSTVAGSLPPALVLASFCQYRL